MVSNTGTQKSSENR